MRQAGLSAGHHDAMPAFGNSEADQRCSITPVSRHRGDVRYFQRVL